MTLSTLAQLQAALPGRRVPLTKNQTPGQSNAFVSYWTATGSVQGSVPPTGSGEVPTSATTGALPFAAAQSGNTLYIANARVMITNTLGTAYVGFLWADRLVHTSGLSGTVTTAQTINSVAVNRPDNTGAAAMAFVEIYSALGTTAQACTVSYTNQSGTAGQSGSVTIGAATANSVGNMLPIALAAGDTGVRSVESITLAGSTGTAGNFGITIMRFLGAVVLVNTGAGRADHFQFPFAAVPSNACLVPVNWGENNVPPVFDVNTIEA